MIVDYHIFTKEIVVAVKLEEFSVEERRKLFNHLLMDKDVNPGQITMQDRDRRAFVETLQKWCNW